MNFVVLYNLDYKVNGGEELHYECAFPNGVGAFFPIFNGVKLFIVSKADYEENKVLIKMYNGREFALGLEDKVTIDLDKDFDKNHPKNKYEGTITFSLMLEHIIFGSWHPGLIIEEITRKKKKIKHIAPFYHPYENYKVVFKNDDNSLLLVEDCVDSKKNKQAIYYPVFKGRKTIIPVKDRKTDSLELSIDRVMGPTYVLHYAYSDVFNGTHDFEDEILFRNDKTLFGKEPFDDIKISMFIPEYKAFHICFPSSFHCKTIKDDDFDIEEIKEEFKKDEDKDLPRQVFETIGLPEGREYNLEVGKPLTIIFCYDSRYNYFDWLSELHPSDFDRGLLKLELKIVDNNWATHRIYVLQSYDLYNREHRFQSCYIIDRTGLIIAPSTSKLSSSLRTKIEIGRIDDKGISYHSIGKDLYEYYDELFVDDPNRKRLNNGYLDVYMCLFSVDGFFNSLKNEEDLHQWEVIFQLLSIIDHPERYISYVIDYFKRCYDHDVYYDLYNAYKDGLYGLKGGVDGYYDLLLSDLSMEDKKSFIFAHRGDELWEELAPTSSDFKIANKICLLRKEVLPHLVKLEFHDDDEALSWMADNLEIGNIIQDNPNYYATAEIDDVTYFCSLIAALFYLHDFFEGFDKERALEYVGIYLSRKNNEEYKLFDCKTENYDDGYHGMMERRILEYKWPRAVEYAKEQAEKGNKLAIEVLNHQVIKSIC